MNPNKKTNDMQVNFEVLIRSIEPKLITVTDKSIRVAKAYNAVVSNINNHSDIAG